MYRNNNKVFAPFQFKRQDTAQELLSGSEAVPHRHSSVKVHPWYLILFLAAILTAAVGLLPNSTRIDVRAECAAIESDGSVQARGELVMRGQMNRYLLREDEFAVFGLQVPGQTLVMIEDQAFPLRETSSCLLTAQFRVRQSEQPDDSDWSTCSLWYPEDQSWWIFLINGQYYVVSTRQNTPPEQIASAFIPPSGLQP